MIDTSARNWWLVILRGILAILFSVAAFAWPQVTIVLMVWMFGIYAILAGLVSVRTGLSRTKTSSRWWAFLLDGLVRIAVGVMALIWPDLATLAIVLLIASWAILTGILEIAAAIRLRYEITSEWLLGLGGIISIVLGVLLLIQPLAGGIAIIWTIAAYAMIFGVLLIVFGFRLRNRSISGPGHRQALHSP